MRRTLGSRLTLPGALLAGAALSALPATAANILNNGSFESGLNGWTIGPSTIWSTDGAAGQGSVRIGGGQGAVGELALSQCAAVAGGSDLDLSAAVRLPDSPDATGGVSLRIVWHDGPACTGGALGLSAPLDFANAPGSAWVRRSLERLRVPPDAVSASLRVVAWSSGPASAFSAYLDDVELAPSPQFATLTLPTAAAVTGARGERFRTTLVVTNPARVGRRVDATLRCRYGEPCANASVSLVLAPRETRVFSDVLFDLFGRRVGAGAIELTYDATLGPIVASALAATVHVERPGNGMALPTLPSSAARRAATFHGLTDGRGGDGSARVNAGVYNPHERWVGASFSVRGEDGSTVATVYQLLAPLAWAQVDDLFGFAGAGAARPGSAVEFAAEAAVFPFLISIDNRSGDPTFLEPGESFRR